MNMFADFEQRIKKLIEAIGIEGITANDVNRVSVESPRDPMHGDLATNAAMVLAKAARTNPRALASQIAERLSAAPDIASAEIAGPGFINLRLQPVFWPKFLLQAIRLGPAYGRGDKAVGKRINVEYVSANPTGPMHVGHCRNAVVGDALANLLAFAGNETTREYVINDAGVQIDALAQSALLRYREALGEAIGEIPAGLYPGDYLKPVGEALLAEFGKSLLAMPEAERLELLRRRTVDAMMAMIRDDLALLGVSHDVFFSEHTLHERHAGVSRIDKMLAEMRARGFVYEGRLPPPKGELPDDWEDREQTLFRSTEVGDDMDRPLIKSDGTYTYFASDVAYFKDKFDRGFERMIYVLGADHSGYVKRLKAVARAVAGDENALHVLLYGLIRLFRGGEPVRMSKRAGEFVTLRDVVDEVGRDAVRFMMLFRKAEAALDFDFAKVTEQSKDNPVFYVQYAHARVKSVERQAALELPGEDFSPEALETADLSLLTDAGELALIRKLAEYPRVIEQSARALEPHRIAYYLHELASELHQHWARGKENPALRFVNHEDAILTRARLAMLRGISAVLASGLAIVGASAPEEMR